MCRPTPTPGAGAEKAHRTDCPACGGFPDFDEEGKVYTCYVCYDTGYVTEAEAAAYFANSEH